MGKFGYFNFKRWLGLAVLLSTMCASAGAASDCALCAPLQSALAAIEAYIARADSRQLKSPDKDENRRQVQLLDAASKAIAKMVKSEKGRLSAQQKQLIVEAIAKASPIDPSQKIIDDNSAFIMSRFEELLASAGQIKNPQTRDLVELRLSIAHDEHRYGQDRGIAKTARGNGP